MSTSGSEILYLSEYYSSEPGSNIGREILDLQVIEQKPDSPLIEQIPEFRIVFLKRKLDKQINRYFYYFDYEGRDFNRRFSQFGALRSMLYYRYPGLIIPPLVEDDDFRVTYLTLFLNKTVSDPILKEDKDVNRFMSKHQEVDAAD